MSPKKNWRVKKEHKGLGVLGKGLKRE